MIVLDMFLLPQAVWQFTLMINETGWYEIGGGAPKGTGLWVMWGIEALIVVGLPTLLATMKTDGVVFCEDCRRWCKQIEKAAQLSLPENIDELDPLHQGDVAPLAHLETVTGEGAPHLSVDTQACGNCNATGAFQTKLVTYQVDKEGKLEEQTADITGLVLVPQTTVDEIATLGQRPAVELQVPDDEVDVGDEEADA